jgi:hypothetical protein
MVLTLLLVMTFALLSVADFRRGSARRNRVSTFPVTTTFKPGRISEQDQTGLSTPVIRSVAFFAWWWTEEQLRAGIDLKKPPKKSYLKIDLLKDGDIEGAHYPEKMDVVCEISNTQLQRATYSIEFRYDLLVAPISYPCRADLSRLSKEVSWSGQVKSRKTYFRRLAPGQTTSVVFKSLRFAHILKYLSGDVESGSLWAWKFRAHISALTNRARSNEGEATLNLLPNSTRCKK